MRSRHGVGIDVQQCALVVGRQRADHRHQAVVQMLADDAGVDRVDVADEAEIHRLGVATRQLHRRAPVRAHQPGIHARQPDRSDIQIAADREDAGIDQPIEHHRGGIDRPSDR